MLVYFLIHVLANYHSAQAAPILIHARALDESPTSLLKRTLFGVVWSCISTTIVCAWTSVHPNVPPPNQWKARWNRLRLMFWMIVAPELVLAWAVRQLFAAKEIRDLYNNSRQGFPKWRRWTLSHGHLLGMGGFKLVDPDLKHAEPEDQHGQVLTYDLFRELIQDPKFEFPDITVGEIQDRSKGDALWKLVAILQTTWFILQCIARGQQGLALTELELITLALASLNAVTFGIWWHKPLGTQEPVRIYFKMDVARNVSDAVDPDLSTQGSSLSFGGVFGTSWALLAKIRGYLFEVLEDAFSLSKWLDDPLERLMDFAIALPAFLLYIFTFPFLVLFPLGIVLLLQVIKTDPVTQEVSQSRGLLAARLVALLQRFRYSATSAVTNLVEKALERIIRVDDYPDLIPFLVGWFLLLPLIFVLLFLFVLLLIPFFTFLFLISFIFTAVFGIVTASTVRPRATYVPTFYAPPTESDRWSRMVVFAVFGVIFGGLHCIGWNFEYPTRSEQTLWRATSLAITGIPLIVAPIDLLLTRQLLNRDLESCGMVEYATLLMLDLIMTILLFIYVPARLSLIAQAVALLRDQPTSALVAVSWTKYIPHLFSQ